MKYFKSITLLCFGFLLTGNLFAQHPTCDGQRYLNPVFPSLDSTMDIQYGANDNAWSFNIDLFMDIYEPAGDTAAMRPAIVFAYGEGFLSGDREDVAGICRAFANQGFVVANIDVRKYPGLFYTDSTQTVDAAIKGTQDVKAAVRFLREDAATVNAYRIDPNFIFAGGVSSGAISSCYTAYMDTGDAISPLIQQLLNDNGGLEGATNNIQQSSAVQGVINWSGGLKDDEMMDANDPPIFSAHDTGDPVVPYGTGVTTVGVGVTIFFEGSATLKARADALGIWNDLYSVTSNDHVSYLTNPNHFLSIFQGSLAMMYEVLCNPATGLEEATTSQMTLYPNPAQEKLNVSIEGEEIWNEIQVVNVFGQVVKEIKFNGAKTTIALDGLGKGFYLVRATSQSGRVLEDKFIIQ